MVYAAALPFAVLLLWAALLGPGWHKSHVTILGLFISVMLTAFLTDVVKNAVGRPRPDLLARCKPRAGTPQNKLVTIDVCTETDHHVLHDGWRSFPSGHSSFAFSGLGYLAMYVILPGNLSSRGEGTQTKLNRVMSSFFAGQLHVFRPQSDLARVLLTLLPLVAAILIAISRCEDYRHDVYDVTVGSLLGLAVAHHTYRKYYPSLQAPRCDVPYPERGDAALAGGMGKLRDEERGPEGEESGEREGERVPLQERRERSRS